nr:hypothetical protein [uncultured Draconibacterium sp.]
MKKEIQALQRAKDLWNCNTWSKAVWKAIFFGVEEKAKQEKLAREFAEKKAIEIKKDC